MRNTTKYQGTRYMRNAINPQSLKVQRNRQGEGYDIVKPSGEIVATGFDSIEEAELRLRELRK
jgi:hypothetical protein